ncbi:MAG TPA: hypothetical protein VFZ15_07785, partial [Acidimicrobiia bacterium]|nr:hypothetical protein [Acidimicrobiia bacterium]
MAWRLRTVTGEDTSLSRLLGTGLLLLIAVFVAIWLFPPMGAAQEGEQGVRVRFLAEDPESGERAPVEGAGVIVLDRDGVEVGQGTSDAEGSAEIPLPPGIYTVEV